MPVVTEILEGVGLTRLTLQPPTECSDSQQTEHLHMLNSIWNGDTVLHTASSRGCANLIPILMLYGADPVVKNDAGHTPYLIARGKEVRDSFRRFMAEYPEAYNYERAHVPTPLTQDMERERSRKEAEKRKEKKKARKQREKVTPRGHMALSKGLSVNVCVCACLGEEGGERTVIV